MRFRFLSCFALATAVVVAAPVHAADETEDGSETAEVRDDASEDASGDASGDASDDASEAKDDASDGSSGGADAAGNKKIDLVFLDFRSEVVDEVTRRALTNKTTQLLSDHGTFNVTSGTEVRQLLEFEAEKLAAGCDTNSCLAEIAGALGARLVVFGEIGKVGATIVLTLSLVDTQASKSVGRTLLEVASEEELYDGLAPAVRDLVAPFLSSEFGIEAPEPEPAVAPEDGSSWLAGTSLGAGTVIAGLGALGVAGGLIPLVLFAANQPAFEALAESPARDPDHLLNVLEKRREQDGYVAAWNGAGTIVASIAGAFIVVGGTFMLLGAAGFAFSGDSE